MTNAIKFATGKPKYKKRQVDWYKLWDEFCSYYPTRSLTLTTGQMRKIENLVNKQLAAKK